MANIKKKEHEKITEANILKVVELLEDPKKPISKKEACAILNISYNTTRLNSIIENWKSDKEAITKRKAEKKGKPVSPGELRQIAEDFLSGSSVQDIAKRSYRSTGFVKNIIQKIGVPERVTGDDKYKTELLPDTCVSEQFDIGEIVWSAVYHSPCEIRGILDLEKYNRIYNTICYRIYIIEKVEEVPEYFSSVNTGGFNAFSPSYDLGKLTHIKELGVDLNRL